MQPAPLDKIIQRVTYLGAEHFILCNGEGAAKLLTLPNYPPQAGPDFFRFFADVEIPNFQGKIFFLP